MRTRIIATVSNNIASDQRLIKVGTTLQKNGYNFYLIGTKHRGVPLLNHIPFKTKRLSVFFGRNFLFYTELQIRLFFQLLREDKKNSVLLANDLDTLLPVYVVARLTKTPLVFDSHEIFSELPSLKKGSIQKKVWQFLEQKLVPKVKYMYTVSDSYKSFFQEKYGVQPKVIKNVPFLVDDKKLITADENKDNQLSTFKYKVIYQGAINYSRGIDKMILAMQFLEDVVLWVVGSGPLLDDYKKLAKDKKVEDKVRFFGRVTPQELKMITPHADAGFSLEEDNGLSYKYALPNKLFDYAHAGIPVLGSCDLPEVKNMIEKYQIGLVVENHEPEHIADKIKTLLKMDKAQFKEGFQKAQAELNWQNQEAELLKIYSDLTEQK